MNPDKSSGRLENAPLNKLHAHDRLLVLLKRGGQSTAADLALALSVTGEAIRQQLIRLQAEGLVESTTQPRGVGRPVQLWNLTAAANSRFPDTHAELTTQLIQNIRQTLGEAALDRVIAARENDIFGNYAKALSGLDGLRQRIARLAEIRDTEGYMAEWEEAGRGFRFIENHCPICTATAACLKLCHAELNLFRRLLGPEVVVVLTEHVLKNGRRCVYRIEPKTSETISA